MNIAHTRGETRTARKEAAWRAAIGLAIAVFALAAVAAALGLASVRAPRSGPGRVTSAWGATVELDGRGVYRYESVSSALQVRANDAITLAIVLPLLVAGIILALQRSQGGALLLAGLQGYFLYTYLSFALGLQLNELFLLYVALFAVSLAGLVFAALSVDVDALAARAGTHFPRRSGVVLSLAVALFLGASWIGGRVLPAMATEELRVTLLEHYHTLFIQALDLGIVVPAAVLTAFWLLRRDARGYILGTLLFVKGATLGLAVFAMGLMQRRAGEKLPLPFLAGFGLLAAVSFVLAVRALMSAGFEAQSRED